jgi:hypothetical protein
VLTQRGVVLGINSVVSAMFIVSVIVMVILISSLTTLLIISCGGVGQMVLFGA